jgi:hypothetical protein
VTKYLLEEILDFEHSVVELIAMIQLDKDIEGL